MRGAIFSILLCLLISAVYLPADAHALTKAGKVLSVRRQVYILRETQRKQAIPETPLFMLDTVETGRASGAKLYFIDDSVLNLSEMSRLVVKEYLYNPEKRRSRAIYRLIRGTMKVFVGDSEMEIHTPTALAAVRGTKFVIWIEGEAEESSTFVHVIDGEVELMNITGGPIMVIRKGQTSMVKGPEPPRLIKGAMVVRLKPLLRRTAVVGRVSIQQQRPPKLPRARRLRPIPKKLRRHIWQRPPTELTKVGLKVLFP
jgi:hypothetical protein